jgi:hypothetical protein
MEVVRVEAPNLLTPMWRIWVQAAISMLGRKAAVTIERISVHASFVTIYAHQAYICSSEVTTFVSVDRNVVLLTFCYSP